MIRSLWALGGPADRRALAGYLATIGSASLLVAASLFLTVPLLRSILQGDSATATPLIVALAVIGALAAVMNGLATAVGQRVGARYVLRMHDLIGRRASSLPLGWFDAERTGPLTHIVTRGVTFAANAPDTMLRPLLQGVLAPLLAGVALLVIDVRVGLCVIVAAVAVWVAYLWAQRSSVRLDEEADRRSEEGAARVIEFAGAQPAVRLAGPDSVAERSVRAAVRAQLDAASALLRSRGRGMTAYTTVCYLALLALVGIATAMVSGGSLDVPIYLALVTLDVLIVWFALHSLPFGQGIQMANRTLADLVAILDAELLPEPETPAMPADGSVEFDGVGFRYPGSERAVLEDVSFSIPARTVTAIVGPSGAGKSTIARLIARFHDVERGAIRVGGVDVRELGTAGTLQQVSMVFQRVHLFEDTLRENIRLGRPSASDAEVDAVAELAGVTEIVSRLPDGMDTRVGEDGGTLSGGERQRVSIARALLKRAPIVLLDEATSALDVDSEHHVQRGLAALKDDTTLIVIAHRMSTIRSADQIIVLDGAGGIEAVGHHETLLDSSATYAGFWAERAESQSWRIDAR